ncbi:MAG: hypothetical protein PF693_06960 [Spirochaetia bacterium]|jgi:hypothetical protein|nr:hypothetical protein [Spirochaetia bacterium]
MKLEHIYVYLTLILLSLLIFSCKDGTAIDPYTVGYLSIDYNTVEPVYEVDFGGDDELVINLSGAFRGQDMFLVKMNSNDFTVDSVSAGYVKSDNISRSLMIAETDTASSVESTLPIKKDHLPSMDFLDLYQPEDESDIFVPSRSVIPERDALVNYGDIGTPPLDSSKDFWVEDENGLFILIPAKLKSVDYYSYIWVADANFTDNPANVTDDNLLNEEQVGLLAGKFNGTSAPGSNDGIYELVTNVCGFEYGGGVAGDGGVDEDKHVNILIYDIDYDYSALQNGGIFGYFWPKDHYNDAVLKSNQSEIFYIDSHFLDGYPFDMYSTLAHEFQHMIFFNRKYIEMNLYNYETWYNEMLSMLIEDIIRDPLGVSVSNSPIERTKEFVDGYYLSGITDWLVGWPDVLYSYASSFMFGAFLTRNFGGAELIEAMIDSDSVDQQSVTDALTTMGYSTETFDSVFDKYSKAIIFSTEDSINDILVTNISTDSSVHSISYNQTAFDIYGYQNSNLYDGPVIFYADSKLDLRPLGMSLHSDVLWFGLNGIESLNFNIVAPSEGVNYYLMFR